MTVRTRFAPSPTGYLHIGGVRTALYAWLLAKHNGGTFILRIEDTDQERKVSGGIRFIVDELVKFGVTIDEGPSKKELALVGEDWDGAPELGGEYGPYIQTLRKPRYKEVAETLIASGHAYRCDCTPEMLEKERNEQLARKELPGYTGYCRTRDVSPDSKHVVRLKVPSKLTLSFDDAIKGRISWDSVSLRDTVLLKSDGLPTYHLAVVTDDHDMKITHIMRGDEWISTTPIHLMLYEALKWEKPVFAHLPVVNGTDGKKLSKRRGAKSAGQYIAEGYLPDALMNYIALVGWSPGQGEEQEIFTIDELIKKFTLEQVQAASATFDEAKLLWMNGVYIRNLSPDKFIKLVEPVLKEKGMDANDERFKKIAPLVQERVKTILEVPDYVEFIFSENLQRETKSMYQKGIDAEKAKEILLKGKERLTTLTEFTHDTIEGVLRGLVAEMGLKAGPLFGVFRIAVLGKPVTPPLFESMTILGKEAVLKRVDEALNSL